MNGYFKINPNTEEGEIEPLDFDKCEFVSEDEDDVDASESPKVVCNIMSV